MNKSPPEKQPFGQRLRSLLGQLEPSRNAAWLAEQSGLSRSTISRLIKGDRNPTLDTAQCLAPVLGVEVEQLLQGTDAEERLGEPTRFILRDHYDQVVHKLVEYEGAASEARRQLEDCRRSCQESKDAQRTLNQRLRAKERELAAAITDRDFARGRAELLDRDLRRHRVALHKAVAEVGLLREKVAELARQVHQTKSAANLGRILAGVGAATGLFTVASLLRESGTDDDYYYDDDEEAEPHAERHRASAPHHRVRDKQTRGRRPVLR